MKTYKMKIKKNKTNKTERSRNGIENIHMHNLIKYSFGLSKKKKKN